MSEKEKSIPQIDPDVTLSIFKKFAEVEEIEDDAAEEIISSVNALWECLFREYDESAAIEERQELEKVDIVHHLKKMELVSNSNELSALLTSHLPRELVVDVLEIAYGQNVVERKKRRQTVTAKCVIPYKSVLDLDVTTVSVGQPRRRLFLNAETDIFPDLGRAKQSNEANN